MVFRKSLKVVAVYNKNTYHEIVVMDIPNENVKEHKQAVEKAHALVNEPDTYSVAIKRRVSDDLGSRVKSEIIYYKHKGVNVVDYHNQIGSEVNDI